MDLMGMAAGLMGGAQGQKVEASALQSILGMVQGHLSQNQGQSGDTNALAGQISEKLGVNSGMVNMVMPQIMQAAQNGMIQNLLDKNQDGKVDLGDLMAMLGK
jgi:hypothetical protein